MQSGGEIAEQGAFRDVQGDSGEISALEEMRRDRDVKVYSMICLSPCMHSFTQTPILLHYATFCKAESMATNGHSVSHKIWNNGY